MKISLDWLQQYLPGPLDPQEIADLLTNAGLPIESIEPIASDTVIDVEVTSNRSDCLSHLGVARELSALLNRPFNDVRPQTREGAQRTAELTSVSNEAPQLCPTYTARILRNVKIAPSPPWMQKRLESVGLRPINNVVDVTNFVLFETGQPLHAFDFDKLQGKRVIVRSARGGEKMVTIDGHERALNPSMLVIADASRAIALAGVMGGKDSEVSPSTTHVLLESARFDPLSVRKTSRTLAIKSDSSYRFERGIDPTLPPRASLRAAELILETAGGELLCGIVEAGNESAANFKQKQLFVRLARIQHVLGVLFPQEQVIDALRRQHFSPQLQGDRIAVTVPSWRLDISLEVDLIEEIARTIGYDKIPVREQIEIRVTPPDPKIAANDLVRSTLVAAGYFEAVTFSWASDALAGDFLPESAAGLPRAEHAVRKADAHLRPSLLPGLLEAVRRNESAGVASARLFEIGSTFQLDAAGQLVENRKLGIVGPTDLRQLRGAIEAAMQKLDPDKPIRVSPQDHRGFAGGACGDIHWAATPVGHLGVVSKSTLAKLDLRETPCAAELDIDALLSGAAQSVILKPIPKFPEVRRDLSLVVPDTLRYEKIHSLVQGLNLDMLDNLEYVTTYRGKPLEKGQKSVTITLVFRSPTTTLTSEQVESSVQKVVTAAQSELGATLRT